MLCTPISDRTALNNDSAVHPQPWEAGVINSNRHLEWLHDIPSSGVGGRIKMISGASVSKDQERGAHSGYAIKEPL